MPPGPGPPGPPGPGIGIDIPRGGGPPWSCGGPGLGPELGPPLGAPCIGEGPGRGPGGLPGPGSRRATGVGLPPAPGGTGPAEGGGPPLTIFFSAAFIISSLIRYKSYVN